MKWAGTTERLAGYVRVQALAMSKRLPDPILLPNERRRESRRWVFFALLFAALLVVAGVAVCVAWGMQ